MNLITNFSLLLFGLLLTNTSCTKGPEEGCSNEFGTNFISTAEIDCCCEYDVDLLREEVSGSYYIRDKDGILSTSLIEIKLDPNVDGSILLKENFLSDFNSCPFIEGEFVIDYTFATPSDPIHETNIGAITKIDGDLFYKKTTRILFNQVTASNYIEEGILVKQ